MAGKMDLDAAGMGLAAWFQRRMPQARDIVLSPLRRPTGGVSSETLLFDLSLREADRTLSRSLVVRWPPSGFTAFPSHAYDMTRQFKLLQALQGSTVPAPPVLGLEEDPSVIGRPFFVMEQVQGWVPGDFPPYHVAGPLFEAPDAERQRIWWDAVDTLGRIHTMDWRAAGLDFLGVPAAGKDFMSNQIARYCEVFALNGEPLPPILARTREWLLANSFEPRHIGLCWGDARLGNLMIRDGRVVAVLDWEMACLGDPESDLGWFAHMDWATSVGRSKAPFPRLSGLPDMSATMAHYTRSTGREVRHLHYYEVFATWRMAILFSRIEQDASYLARSGNAKGFITWTHFDKLERMLDA